MSKRMEEGRTDADARGGGRQREVDKENKRGASKSRGSTGSHKNWIKPKKEKAFGAYSTAAAQKGKEKPQVGQAQKHMAGTTQRKAFDAGYRRRELSKQSRDMIHILIRTG